MRASERCLQKRRERTMKEREGDRRIKENKTEEGGDEEDTWATDGRKEGGREGGRKRVRMIARCL